MQRYLRRLIVTVLLTAGMGVIASQPAHATSTEGYSGVNSKAAVLTHAQAIGSRSSSPALVAADTSSPVWFFGSTSPQLAINDASCWGPEDCLAVGSSAAGDDGIPLSEWFTNGIPSTAPAPPVHFAPEDYGFTSESLSCMSATFCMLANGASTPSVRLLLFNGSSWQDESSPSVPALTELGSVSCGSTTLCAAAGWYPGDGGAPQPIVEEYDNGIWSLVSLPPLPSGTTATVATVAGCAETFCMVGPVAQSGSGALWMATSSGGAWSDTEISTLDPTGSAEYQVGSIDCIAADSCMVGVLPPADQTAGFVAYTGSWGALSPIDVAAEGESAGLPSLSCLSLTDCLAAVLYDDSSGLQEFDGSSWTSVAETVTPPHESGPLWVSVSCGAEDACLGVSQQGYAVQHDPFTSAVSVTVDQVGPKEVTVDADVQWQELANLSLPGPVTFDFEGNPVSGCEDVPAPNSTNSPAIYSCEVDLSSVGSYSFSASVASDTYYSGSSSAAVNGSLGDGYWEIGADGSVYPFGFAELDGTPLQLPLNAPVVGGAVYPPFDLGYWLVAADGGVFSYGLAPFYGSTGSIHLNKPVVGMAATPEGGGYWFVASDGGVFAYGDAGFYGSTGSIHLNQPVVGMASTPDGRGYWLVAADGGIFAFGDAGFYGSTGSIHLNQPVVGMVPTPDGRGYWFVASDGGVFAYGDAPYLGSEGGAPLPRPIVSIQST
jgi:hypothetical protein